MWGWILGTAPLALLGGGAYFRGRKYRRLFSDAHLLEVALAVANLKKAALANLLTPGEAPARGDPRLTLTSVGLVIGYTVHRGQTEFTHHCSISLAGDITAHGLGTTFMSYFVLLVGWPLNRTSTFQYGKSMVHHAEIALSPAEHEAFAAKPVRQVSPATVAELLRTAMDARSDMTWTVLEPPSTKRDSA